MSKKQRLIAIAMAAVILFMSLSFMVYSAHNMNHDCSGESCSVCARIEMCKNLIKTIYVAVIAIFITSVSHKIGRRVLRSTKQIEYNSPVIMRVRLLN